MKNKVFFRSDIMRDTDHGVVAVASRCKLCGATYFPAEARCHKDLSTDMEEIEVPKYGTMYAFTVVYRPVNLYPVPHGLCKVDFDNGLRIEGPMVIADKENLVRGHEFRIGSKMETVIDTLWEDEQNAYIGYKFKVIAEPGEG